MSGGVYLIEDNAGFVDRFLAWWETSDKLHEGYEIVSANTIDGDNAYTILQRLLDETRPVLLLLDYHLQPLTGGDATEIIQRIKAAPRDSNAELEDILQGLALGSEARMGLLFLAAALANTRIPRVGVIQVSASERPIDWNGGDEAMLYPLIQWAKDTGRLFISQARTFKFFSPDEFASHYDKCMRWLRQGERQGPSLDVLLDELSKHTSRDDFAPAIFAHCGDAFWQFLGIPPAEATFLSMRSNQGRGRHPFVDGLRGFGDADPPGFNIASGYLCALAAHRVLWPKSDWQRLFVPDQACDIDDIRRATIAKFVSINRPDIDKFWSRNFTRAFFEMCLRFMESGEDILHSVSLRADRLELAFSLGSEEADGLHQTLMARRRQLLLLMRHRTSLQDGGRIIPMESEPGKLGHDRSYWVWEVQLMRMLSQDNNLDVFGRERTSFEVFVDQGPPALLVVRFLARVE